MSTQRKSRGGTLLEAAIVLLVLFTFLMGIIDLGIAYNVYQTMTDAAREGARFAVAPCSLLDATGCPYSAGNLPTVADVKGRVQKYLDVAAVHKTATVDVTQIGTATKYTQVTVSEPYQFFFLPWPITLRTQAVMRNETN